MAQLLLPVVLAIGLFSATPASADFGSLPQVNLIGSFDAGDSIVRGVSIWNRFRTAFQTAVERMREYAGRGDQDGGIVPVPRQPGGGAGAGLGGGAGAGVPELDVTVAGSAIVLLLGGVAYFASRRREQE